MFNLSTGSMSNGPQEPNMAGPAIEETHGHILAGDPEEWEYPMRRSMQEIIPNIYLGPYACARKNQLGMLQSVGITHIVCVRQEIESKFVKANFPEVFDYLVIDLSDDTSENIIQHFPRVSQYIDTAVKAGGRVLMHGNAGISRSGSLLIAYIMKHHNLSYSEALRLVQLRRFCVSPNEGFQAQLMEYEPIYRAQKMAETMNHNNNNNTTTTTNNNNNNNNGMMRRQNAPQRKREYCDDDDEDDPEVVDTRNPANFKEPVTMLPLPGHGAYVTHQPHYNDHNDEMET